VELGKDKADVPMSIEPIEGGFTVRVNLRVRTFFSSNSNWDETCFRCRTGNINDTIHCISVNMRKNLEKNPITSFADGLFCG
jgi:hypothetical protein